MTSYLGEKNKWSDNIASVADLVVYLSAELVAVTRERDTAIEQLRSADNCCDYCQHSPTIECDFDCDKCPLTCYCRGCTTGENFRWKGSGSK